MAVDPYLSLQQPNIPQIAQQWMGLSEMSNALQIQRWQMQQAQEDKRKRAAFLELYKDPQNIDENGLVKLSAIGKMYQIDPASAEQVAKTRVSLLDQMEQTQKRRTDEQEKKVKTGLSFSKRYMSHYETAKEQNQPDTLAMQTARAKTLEDFEDMRKSGQLPGFTSADDTGFRNVIGSLTYDRARSSLEAALPEKEAAEVLGARRAETKIREAERGAPAEIAKPAGGVPLSDIGAQPRMVEGAAGEVVPQRIDPTSGAVIRGFTPTDVERGGPAPVMVSPDVARGAQPTVAPIAPPSEERQISNEIAALQKRQSIYRSEGLTKRADEIDKQIEKRREDLNKLRKSAREEELMPLRMNKMRAEVELKHNTQQSLTPETARLIAEMFVDGNTQAAVGFARNSTAKNQLSENIAAVAKERGMSAKDINASIANFRGLMTEETVLGRRAGGIGIAINELKGFIPEALKASTGVPRSEFRPYNELQRMWQEKVVMTPQQRALRNWTQAIINANAQIIARGGQNVHSLLTAEQNLTTADSPAVYEESLRVMWEEAAKAMQAVGGAREDIRAQIRGEEPYAAPFPGEVRKPGRVDTKGKLTPEEQKELERLRKKYGR